MSTPMSWEEIKHMYPNQWVAIEDRTVTNGVIISAVVIDFCDDSKVADMRRKYRPVNHDKHIWFVRTAEGNVQYYVNLINAQTDIVGVK